jgi:SAM-dependent methyltransferase
VRDHNKAFCRAVAENLDCPGPIYEFGSFQVEGQEGYADLRGLFRGQPYVGCDFRPGPGVDRVEDVSRMTLPDACAGTVLSIETFEHVFEIRRAFDEVFRILKPGGLFVITSPLNFGIHGYPDDYWRMTPSCLRRMLGGYGARLCGSQGHAAFPHTVMAVAVKSPAPADFAARAEAVRRLYGAWLEDAERSLPPGTKLRRRLARLYRSKGERRHLADYYKADLEIELGPAPMALAG